MQREIKQSTPLHNEFGELSQIGYAKSLILDYSRKAIQASKFRIKEWDYYLIYNNDYALALTIADNGYMGLLSASVIDFKTPTETTKSVMTLLPLGKFNLPESSNAGTIRYSSRRIKARFETKNGRRKLFFEMKKFSSHDSLKVNLELFDEPSDSIVMATPFKEDKKAFYYNQKIVGMRASGCFEIGKKIFEFSPISTYAVLDWGRGVWTYKNTWYWGAAAGWHSGKTLSFNIGYGFGNNDGATENAVFYDGIMHKLEHVSFDIPKDSKNKDDFMSQWQFSSSDKRFEMKFTPIINRHSNTSALIISSNQNQIFGRFDGYIILDNGKKLVIHNFLGFAEKVVNKW